MRKFRTMRLYQLDATGTGTAAIMEALGDLDRYALVPPTALQRETWGLLPVGPEGEMAYQRGRHILIVCMGGRILPDSRVAA